MVGYLVLPVQRAQFEILLQCGTEYLNTSVVLTYSHIMGVVSGECAGGVGACKGILHAEIRVVGDVFKPCVQGGLGARIMKPSFHPCAQFTVKSFMVPPCKLGMVMAQVETRLGMVKMGMHVQSEGVLGARPNLQV